MGGEREGGRRELPRKREVGREKDEGGREGWKERQGGRGGSE